MTVISYCKQLHKRLIIKTALSHLLLGVIAAGFGLYQQPGLPAQSSISHVDIIAIAAIVQDHQAPSKSASQTLPLSAKRHAYVQINSPIYDDLSLSKVVRLSPDNAIRAGPITTV
ncbi:MULTISPECIES: hypothetical protein [unclassified Gilliamella]|uniref:hypothetical protein n=1 Tax=unclassified Gilliamella TaxID=2685620 RepID=UPI00226A50D1|nr:MULTISPECIES: hypothetical protein [unclassified Gilliamella]MCX8601250.1 hypothetical protein [Gilliamella sp. B3722]MCX8607404.1 hypothetical protein [Gilliamella sp. B3771]MCX8610407.1 hypothetical protein [Gilliamella sp. B3891]MCX8612924.1 hypothetical protein [Gilliamella sp. B3773]MCX8614833.1 hypothetical protein [Gilliamella sp. B3770]